MRGGRREKEAEDGRAIGGSSMLAVNARFPFETMVAHRRKKPHSMQVHGW